MAKVSLTKLGLAKDTSVSTFEWNGQAVEVKQYLPLKDKLTLVETIVNNSLDDNNYFNIAAVYVNTVVETVLAYTNITVTEKQKEDIEKLYDLFTSSGFSGEVIGNQMNPSEYAQIKAWVAETIKNIYDFKNSAVGIVSAITQDYSNLELDATEIQKKLTEGGNVDLLKDILTKLG